MFGKCMLCDVLCYFSNFCYPRSNYHLSNFLYLVVAFYLYLDRTPYLQPRSWSRVCLSSTSPSRCPTRRSPWQRASGKSGVAGAELMTGWRRCMYEYLVRNVERLVLGSIKADFCIQFSIFSWSTSFHTFALLQTQKLSNHLSTSFRSSEFF